MKPPAALSKGPEQEFIFKHDWMCWGLGGGSCPFREVLGLKLKQAKQHPEGRRKGGREGERLEKRGQRHLRHPGTGTGRDPRGEGAWRGEDAGWGDFSEGAKQNSNAKDEKQTEENGEAGRLE